MTFSGPIVTSASIPRAVPTAACRLASRFLSFAFLLSTLLCAICLEASPASAQDAPVTVGYIRPGPPAGQHASLGWLSENDRFRLRRLDVTSARARSEMREADVLWVHLPDSVSYAAWQKQRPQASDWLRTYYEQGGRLLLTNFAARLPHAMGIESVPPEKRVSQVENDEHNDKKGYQSFRGHPVFTRGILGGGNFWDATRDYRIPRIGYFGKRSPREGKVAAVERARTSVRMKNRLLVEYGSGSQDGSGRALAAGAFIYLNRPNSLRAKMERFLENALLYLDGALTTAEASGPLPSGDLKTYWPHVENAPKRFSARSEPLDRAGRRALRDLPQTNLLLKRNDPQDHFWDLAGRRAFLMGHENGGLDEVWTPPFKTLYDYEAGLVVADSIAWLRDLPLRVEVRPESFTRIYETPRGPLREVIYPGMQEAGGIAHYEAGRDLQLAVRFKSDLRYMWPYPKSALGNVYYAYDEGLGALRVRDKTGDFYSFMGGDLSPRQRLTGPYGTITWDDGRFQGTSTDNNQVAHAALFELTSENDYALNYAFAGTNEGEDAAMQDYRAMLENPRETYANLVRHYRDLLGSRVTLDTPNDTLDTLWRWALVGTDRFVIRTPHLGTGLTAGYATTDLSGGTWASSTPGYGWYFGRDGEWVGFAVDAYGDFEVVKKLLQLLQRFQDVRGKVFHALNTAGPGVQQYNAADSTPLYVVLAADYLRASGDRAFIRKNWPHVKQAMEFLYSTDTDGDGLIENTNVGHGWVEFGALGGAHTTFYLAGVWAQALEEAAYMAGQLGKDALQQQYSNDAEAVRATLNTDFWDADAQFFYQAKKQDEGYISAQTILPTVPMLFGEIENAKARPVLQTYAANRFSTDWGTRILNRRSQLYDPSSYHAGSVWPLFTGWTALAEYTYGRPANGFMHIANSLFVKDDWALSFVEEVLNGDRYSSDGVTHHQAWSETAILHPTISGMIGWAPNAPERTAALQPQFPVHWPRAEVENLRVGSSTVNLRMERSEDATRYRLELTGGPPVEIRLAPGLPAGQRITEARVGGQTVAVSSQRERGRLAEPIRIRLTDTTTVALRHTGGVGMAAVVPKPRSGDRSRGYRIINDSLDGNTYRVTLAGRAETSHVFRLRTFGQEINGVEGATLDGRSDQGIARLAVPFRAGEGRFTQKTVTVQLAVE